MIKNVGNLEPIYSTVGCVVRDTIMDELNLNSMILNYCR